MIETVPGTVVYTDIARAWSTLALYRFQRERDRAGLTEEYDWTYACPRSWM